MRRWVLLAALAVLGAGVASANTAPLADAGLDQRVDRNVTVYLDAGGSTDPDGTVTGYTWTIAAPDGTDLDPNCRTCERTQFVPNQTGQYSVTVTVTDDDGATREDTLFVSVEQAAPPAVEVTGPSGVLAGDTQTYHAEATAGDADLSTVSWRVDGSHHDHVAVDGDTETVTANFSFSGGNHTVTAVVIDDSGKRDTDEQGVRAVDTSNPIGIDAGGGGGGGGGGGTLGPEAIDGNGDCTICTSDGLITLNIEGEGDDKTANWEVNQDLASRIRGSDATVKVGSTEVHTSDLAEIPESNEGEELLKRFSKAGVTERDLTEGAAAGISEKNNFQATGKGSLGSISNERSSVDYDGWLPSKESEINSVNSATESSSVTTYDRGSTADKLFSGGGASTSDDSGSDSSSSWSSGNSNDTGRNNSSGSSNDSGSSSNHQSGGYHGGSSYTGGGGYGF
jgi:PKD domain.